MRFLPHLFEIDFIFNKLIIQYTIYKTYASIKIVKLASLFTQIESKIYLNLSDLKYDRYKYSPSSIVFKDNLTGIYVPFCKDSLLSFPEKAKNRT